MEKIKFIIEEANINFFTWSYHSRGFQNILFPEIGKYLMPVAFILIKENDGKWGIVEKEWNKNGKQILKDIKEKKLDCVKFEKKSNEIGEKLIKYCLSIEQSDLTKLSDKELIEYLKFLYYNSIDLVSLGGVPVVGDFHHFAISNELKDMTQKKIEEYGLKRRVQEYTNILTSPKELTEVQKENIEFLRITKLYKEDKDVKDKIEDHTKKYCWIEYGYQGPAHNSTYFMNQIKEAIKKFNDIDAVIKEIYESKEKTNKLQREFLEELRTTDDDKLLFDTARIFLQMKGFRIIVRHQVNYNCDRIFEELTKRKDITIKHFRAMNVEEIEEYILNGNLPENLNKRFEHFGALFKDQRFNYFYGEDLDKFLEENIEKEKIEEIERFHGQAACLGRVVGPAKIVNRIEDITKMNKGDILVSIQTNPDLVPAMERAAGFVTNTGGLTCHAAIVAREMNKPCITGTNVATKVIKDGDIIEINAQHGTVRILKKAKK